MATAISDDDAESSKKRVWKEIDDQFEDALSSDTDEDLKVIICFVTCVGTAICICLYCHHLCVCT